MQYRENNLELGMMKKDVETESQSPGWNQQLLLNQSKVSPKDADAQLKIAVTEFALAYHTNEHAFMCYSIDCSMQSVIIYSTSLEWCKRFIS